MTVMINVAGRKTVGLTAHGDCIVIGMPNVLIGG
jgi:hypothetical protein